MDSGGRVVWYFDADLGNFTKGVDTASKAVSSVSTAMQNVEKTGRSSLGGLAGVAQDLSTNFSDLGAGLSLIGTSFAGAGKAVSDIASQISNDVIDLATAFGNVLADGASSAFDSISHFTGGLIDTINQTQVVQSALGVLSGAYVKLSGIVSSAINAIQGKFDVIAGVANNIASRIDSVFSAVSGKIGTAFKSIETTLTSGIGVIQSTFSRAGNAVSDFASKLSAPIVQSRAFQVATSIASTAGDGFQRAISGLGTAATAVGGRIEALGVPISRLGAALGPIPGLFGSVAGSIGKIGFSVAEGGASALASGLGYLGTQAVAAASKISQLAVSAGKLAFNGIEKAAVGAGSAMIALGIKGISSANGLQSLQLSMNGLTHSMDLGAQAMAGAYAYAQKAPFQLPDVAATTKTLIAFGQTAQEAVSNLDVLGNVSITTGIPLQSLGGIFGQVSAQGTLMLGDIRQLTQDGVAILPALQKEFGKTAAEVQDMATRGQISFEQFRIAMGTMVDPTILDQLNNTLPRQIDRLGGSVRQLSNAFVGVSVDSVNGFQQASGGIAAASTTLVKTVADVLRSPEIKTAAANLGNAIVPLISAITKIITPLANGIASIADAFSKVGTFALPFLGLMAGAFSGLASSVPVLGELIGGLTGPIGLVIGILGTLFAKSPELRQAFSDAFTSIGTVIQSLAPIFSQVAGLLTQIFVAVGGAIAPLVGALASAFGQILTAVAPLIPVFAQLFLDIIQKVVVPIIPFVVQVIGILAQVFTAVFTAITPLLPIISTLIVTIFQQILLPILPLVVQLIQLLAGVLIMVLNAVVPLLPQIVGLVTVLITSLAPILPQIVNLFIQLVIALIPLIPPLLQLVVLLLPPLVTVLTVVANLMGQTLTIAITLAISAIRTVIGFIAFLVEGIAHAINFVDRLANIVSVQFNNLKNAVGDSIGGAINEIGKLPGQIINVFSSAGDSLRNIGHKIIDGLVNGIKDKFADVKNTLGDLTKKLTSWKGPEALDRVLLTPNGNLIMDGFLNGLESSYGGIETSLKNFTKSLGGDVSLGINANVANNAAVNAVQPVIGSLASAQFTGNSPTTIENHIGTIQLSNDVDAENFLKKLTRQDEITSTGLTA